MRRFALIPILFVSSQNSTFIISRVMYDPLHSPDCNHLKLLTRYLSGILEMPTFREDAFYKDQCFAVEKFCTRAVELIKDTDLTSDDLENEPGQLASMDLDDIDLLADSILAGVETWMKKKEANELRDGCWVSCSEGKHFIFSCYPTW